MNKLIFKTPVDASDDRDLRDKFTTIFSRRLREIRTSKKMTQQELSEKAGLHLSYVGHLELGKYRPTLYVAWKLSQVLGVSLEELTN